MKSKAGKASKRIKFGQSILAMLLAGTEMFLAVQGGRPVQARETAGGWSAPVNLSNSETQSTNPSMAADPGGGVHVVWAEETGDGRSFISYSSYANGSWSPANEILNSPVYQDAGTPSIAADSRGYLHVAWQGDLNIQYSSAYAPLAGSAQNWSPPRALEYTEEDIAHPDLVIDKGDVLHLVYAINLGSNSGIYYLQSKDYGQSWTDPVTITTNPANRMVDYPRIAAGPDGRLHVAWVEYNYPETFPAIGIRYAWSDQNGEMWSSSISIADGPYSFPAIATRDPDEVHVVFSGSGDDRYKFHRWSADGGQSWFEIWRNTDLGGYQQLPALVTDSNQVLHWLTVGTVYSINNDSLYYTFRAGDQWSPGEVVLRDKEGIGQNSANVSAVVATGNQLFSALQYPIVSTTQAEGWQNEIYVMNKILDAPLIQPKKLPTLSAVISTIAPYPIITLTTNPPKPTISAINTQPSHFTSSPFIVIGAGLIVSLAVVTVLIMTMRKH